MSSGIVNEFLFPLNGYKTPLLDRTIQLLEWEKQAVDNYRAAHPLGGSEERMKEHYNFFCDATHPNRELIPRRFLGEGNQFVLGVIGKPNLTMITEYCMSNLEMWSWMTNIVSYFYRDTIKNFDNEYFKTYSYVKKSMEKIYILLGKNFNRLPREEEKYWKEHPLED